MFSNSIQEFFKQFYKEYRQPQAKVDRTTKAYQLITSQIPKLLDQEYPDDKYKIYGSLGQGNLSKVPWFGIFNRQMTESATYGIYIVYLYSLEREKIYLTLNQGFTNFKDIFKRKRFEYIRKTAIYFANEMNMEDFDSGIIDLGDDLTDLAKGYAYGSIVHKSYDLNNMPKDQVLYTDLKKLMIEYDELVSTFGTKNYDDIIRIVNGIDDQVEVDKAIKEIGDELKKTFVTPVDVFLKPREVIKGEQRKLKYNRIKTSIQRQKLDYIRLAKEQARIGLQGERLALEIEKERIEKLGLNQEKVKWRSTESDSFGYDIESVDMINGKEQRVFIEVKSTSDRIDSPFYVSKNQVETSNSLGINYRILRLFDVDSTEPKYYYSTGKIEDNFDLDPVTYLATNKYDVH